MEISQYLFTLAVFAAVADADRSSPPHTSWTSRLCLASALHSNTSASSLFHILHLLRQQLAAPCAGGGAAGSPTTN